MVGIYINNKKFAELSSEKRADITKYIYETIHLKENDFFLLQNGQFVKESAINGLPIHCHIRVCGGKGGFGSMLRAIGAQIEKTTNREACRDLSGRRLRDINEEKRLKAWLEKQGEREREAEERKKRKIEKLLAVPKHEFKDEEYEKARSKLTEKVNDAVEEGLKKAQLPKASTNDLKRGGTTVSAVQAKKKKPALWIGDDISDDSDDDNSDNSSTTEDNTLEKPNKERRKSLSLNEDENENKEKQTSATVEHKIEKELTSESK